MRAVVYCAVCRDRKTLINTLKFLPGSSRGMWDQGSAEGWDLGSQAMGSGSAVFLGIRDQDVSFLWDQGPKFVTLLETRIANLGTKMGSLTKNIPRRFTSCY